MVTNLLNERKREMTEKELMEEFIEKKEFKNVLKDGEKLLKPIINILSLKGNSPDYLDKMAKELKSFHTEDELLMGLRAWKEKANSFLEQAKNLRSKQFNRIESSFIRAEKEKSKEIREMNNGWRIGILELAVNRSASQVRFLYNNAVIIDWKPVSEEEDIKRYEEEALMKLQKYIIPKEKLLSYFSRSYNNALGNVIDSQPVRRVPILTFYQQFRLLLLQEELEKKGLGAKLDYAEFPKYAFLYNLDLYLSYSNTLPYSERLILQTGSQQEVAQGKGLIVNGLHPLEDYKVMCYILPFGGGKQ